jgi:phosphatidylserine/phosphatidylglycerophosphate/cardiolipin synthase-like enzyme
MNRHALRRPLFPFLVAVALVVNLSLSASLVPAAAAASLTVVIKEVAWMGTTTSVNHEWLSLYNNTDGAIDLTGWTLTAADGTPAIALSGVIPAQGHFLLERTSDSSVPGVPADLIYTGALGDNGEDLLLRDAGSNLIDRVNSSAGWFAGHKDGRVPMLRLDTTADGSLPDNWQHNPRCGTATNSAGLTHTCTLTVTVTGETLDYAVYFNDRAATATDISPELTVMEAALLDLLDGATTSIEITMYGLNRQRLITALIAAHNRGVNVRVVGDLDAATGAYAASYQALAAAGLPVVLDNSTSRIQHNKFVVIDGQYVWTGSANFTDTDFTLNANNSIAITSTALANVYQTEFAEMWAGNFQNNKTDNTPHLLDYSGTLVESYFSPTDLVAFEVWDRLASVEQSIHFAMFFWTDQMLASRAVERVAAGAQLYGLWDGMGAAHGSSMFPFLCAGGGRIKVEDFAGKLHHKYAVLDVDGPNPAVVLGSYNWSDAGAYSNDENTLIIHDPELAQAYYAEWRHLWQAIPVARMCNPLALYLPTIVQQVGSP